MTSSKNKDKFKIEDKALNQTVKRNISRFPESFRFQISDDEKDELVTNCDQFKTLKHSSLNPMHIQNKV